MNSVKTRKEEEHITLFSSLVFCVLFIRYATVLASSVFHPTERKLWYVENSCMSCQTEVSLANVHHTITLVQMSLEDPFLFLCTQFVFQVTAIC